MPGVASNGARTVLAESVEMVAVVLGRDSIEATSDVDAGAVAEDFSCVGVMLSEGVISGDCFTIICSCFFAIASLILRRITSSPCASCANTVVTCGCTAIGRVDVTDSLAFRGTLGLVSGLARSTATAGPGDVGVP